MCTYYFFVVEHYYWDLINILQTVQPQLKCWNHSNETDCLNLLKSKFVYHCIDLKYAIYSLLKYFDMLCVCILCLLNLYPLAENEIIAFTFAQHGQWIKFYLINLREVHGPQMKFIIHFSDDSREYVALSCTSRYNLIHKYHNQPRLCSSLKIANLLAVRVKLRICIGLHIRIGMQICRFQKGRIFVCAYTVN